MIVIDQIPKLEWGVRFGTGAPPDLIGDALRADAVAYWKMDETSGTRFDATAHGNDLGQLNSVGSISGKIGNGLQCDADGDYARLTNTNFDFGDTNHAFAFWLKINTLPADGFSVSIISKGEEFIDGEYFIEIENEGIGGHIVVSFFGIGGFSCNTDSFGDLQGGVWYYIVVEYDTTADQTRIYINNQIYGESVFTTPASIFGHTFSIGSDIAAAVSSFLGVIDEVLILNRLTSSDERTYLYNSGAGRALFP